MYGNSLNPRQKHNKEACLKVLAAFSLVVAFTLVHPVTQIEPDAWNYFFAARCFGDFSLTIDEKTYRAWVAEAMDSGHKWQGDIGFAPVGEGRYGFIKSPGYPMLLAPFAGAGVERLLNLVLGCLVVLAAFYAFSRLLHPGAGLTASLLMMFSPGFLIMIHRPFMSDFASFAFTGTGAALYLIYLCREEKEIQTGWLLFAAGLALGLSVAVRYTNLPVTLLFAFHFLFVYWRKKRHLERPVPKGHLLVFFFPLILVFCLTCLYHSAAFGSPWRVGYQFIEHPRNEGINFVHQYLAAGRLHDAFYSLVRNFAVIPEFVILLLPVTILLFPGMCSYRILKGRYFFLILFWMVAFWLVYAEYVLLQASVYLIIGRMYLPVLFPAALFGAAFLHRFNNVERRACVTGIAVLGFLFFFAYLALEGIGPFGMSAEGLVEKMQVIVWQGADPPFLDPG